MTLKTSTLDTISLTQTVTPGEMLLVIAPESLKKALNIPASFAVIDTTSGGAEINWEGRLFVRGW